MKTLNLYLKMHFTSLSPDAQPISLGIVTEEVPEHVEIKREKFSNGVHAQFARNENPIPSKSFYAEFTQFERDRCDDWAKNNVLNKLQLEGKHVDWFDGAKWEANSEIEFTSNHFQTRSTATGIKLVLKYWLSQFSQYQLQFVVDCGTWDWYYFLQLIGKWNELPETRVIPLASIPFDKTLDEFIEEWENADENLKLVMCHPERVSAFNIRTGLPKLPPNVSPVPTDLNDRIAFRNDITPMEAFNMNREDHLTDLTNTPQDCENKYNALHDATIIKQIHQIYRKL